MAVVVENATKPSRSAHFWQGAQFLSVCHAKRHLNLQKWSEPLVFFYILTSTCAWRHNGVHIFDISTSKNGLNPWCFTFWLRNVLRATTACTFSTLPLLKVLRTPRAFYILTSKCASRHTACTFSTSQLPKVLRSWSVCFAPQRRALFHIPTFKSVPNPSCFLHVDFEMCFAPQQRALFRHLNFQKCSEAEVFCTCWLRNVLRATTACNFSSLIWPDGSAPAALASLLFDPPEPQIIGKTPCFATFIFFLLTLSLLWSSLFYSSLLSDSSHLCFSSVHIVGSLTSKFPSISIHIIYIYIYIYHNIYIYIIIYISLYIYIIIYISLYMGHPLHTLCAWQGTAWDPAGLCWAALP